MISYIASNPTNDLIENTCKKLNITILSNVGEIDFLNYIKETKVNFKLIKYIVIDLKSLLNTEENQINSICYFKEVYQNIRIIILASGYDEQSNILTTLYEKGIYNIINSSNVEEIKKQLIKSFSIEGIDKKETKKFKKTEEIKVKKYNKLKALIKSKRKMKVNNNEKEQTQANTSVYFFAILIQAVSRLIELIGIAIIFGLTSLGLTILFNESLRSIVFQIFGLK